MSSDLPKNGVRRFLILQNGDFRRPPPNKLWLILAGQLSHITGTNTIFDITTEEKPATAFLQLAQINANVGTNNYPLFTWIMDFTVTAVVYIPAIATHPNVVVSEQDFLHLTCNAVGSARILVWEFPA